MKNVHYYYIRGKKLVTKVNGLVMEHNPPVITVCIITNDKGLVSRGIAICSANDNINKEKGREEAFKRAKEGMRGIKELMHKINNKKLSPETLFLCRAELINFSSDEITNSMIKFGWKTSDLTMYFGLKNSELYKTTGGPIDILSAFEKTVVFKQKG